MSYKEDCTCWLLRVTSNVRFGVTSCLCVCFYSLPTVVKVHHNDSTNNHNNIATLLTQFEHPLSTLSLAVSHHSLQPGDYMHDAHN